MIQCLSDKINKQNRCETKLRKLSLSLRSSPKDINKLQIKSNPDKNSWVVDLQLHVFLYPSPFPDTVYFHIDFKMVIADDSSDNLLNTGLKIMEIKMAYLKVAKLFCENKWIKIIVWPQNKSLTSFKSYFRIKITHANFTRVLGGILECTFEAERPADVLGSNLKWTIMNDKSCPISLGTNSSWYHGAIMG